MSPNRLRTIAIALVIIALLWTLLSFYGVSGLPPSWIRTVLLVLAIVLLLLARRGGKTVRKD